MPIWVRAGERPGGTLPPRMSVKASLESWLGFLEFVRLGAARWARPPLRVVFSAGVPELHAHVMCMCAPCGVAKCVEFG